MKHRSRSTRHKSEFDFGLRTSYFGLHPLSAHPLSFSSVARCTAVPRSVTLLYSPATATLQLQLQPCACLCRAPASRLGLYRQGEPGPRHGPEADNQWHALYVLEASRIHIRYMRIGCMQSTLWPILMTMLIWNDLMDSQHDNLSRGSPRLMTSDRQILYPHDGGP